MPIDISVLKQRQSLPLEGKIILSEARIRDWYNLHNGMVYISFSGGKDSTVLLHLVRQMYPDVPAVFLDTGLEYPEIRDFVKTKKNVTFIRPTKTFTEVIEEFGFPVVSKEQAWYVEEFRTTKSERLRQYRWNGNAKGQFRISTKWRFLVDAPFKISQRCCDFLKKNPAKTHEKETGRLPFTGNMAEDSMLRRTNYLRNGCNGSRASTPLAFWTTEDIWDYLKRENLPYSNIYDMGYAHTGCMFCAFGVHREKYPNKFQLMSVTHPQLHTYCMEKLGMREVLDYIHVPTAL